MPASRTFLPDPDLSQRQGNIIVNNDHIPRPNLKAFKERRHRGATVIHISLRRYQYSPLSSDHGAIENQCLPTSFLDTELLASREPLQNSESDIVICAGVFFARI